MVELDDQEAAELRERLSLAPEAKPAEETIAVSANASTSVRFTERQEAAVLAVLNEWVETAGSAAPRGVIDLRDALAEKG